MVAGLDEKSVSDLESAVLDDVLSTRGLGEQRRYGVKSWYWPGTAYAGERASEGGTEIDRACWPLPPIRADPPGVRKWCDARRRFKVQDGISGVAGGVVWSSKSMSKSTSTLVSLLNLSFLCWILHGECSGLSPSSSCAERSTRSSRLKRSCRSSFWPCSRPNWQLLFLLEVSCCVTVPISTSTPLGSVCVWEDTFGADGGEAAAGVSGLSSRVIPASSISSIPTREGVCNCNGCIPFACAADTPDSPSPEVPEDLEGREVAFASVSPLALAFVPEDATEDESNPRLRGLYQF